MFTTSFLEKNGQASMASSMVADGEPSQVQCYRDDWNGTVDYAISDANAVEALKQQLGLVAIATLTAPQVKFTIHHAVPTDGLNLCQLINSHSFKQWLSQLPPLQPRRFSPALSSTYSRHIYGCQYQRMGRDAQYLVVWANAALTPLQQFCLEQQARHFAHLEQQQQMRTQLTALEETIRQVGHQLRTPLASIELYADGLCRLGDAPEGARAIGQLVQRLSHTLRRLTHQSAATLASQQNLQTIALGSIQELRPQLDQKQIALVGERCHCALDVDPWQLQQVFNNLIGNAIAFSPQNGIIEFCWQGYNSEILIEIRDQGPGFSPGDLRHVFKRYYSRRPDGQGLGLTIAQKIIHDHGGTIWVTNLPQGGAQVSISLPRQR